MKLICREVNAKKEAAKSKDINCCVLEGVLLMFTNDLHIAVMRRRNPASFAIFNY